MSDYCCLAQDSVPAIRHECPRDWQQALLSAAFSRRFSDTFMGKRNSPDETPNGIMEVVEKACYNARYQHGWMLVAPSPVMSRRFVLKPRQADSSIDRESVAASLDDALLLAP
ncbi:MAG: hypothetical protein ABSG53_22405 [Thermoguttaceae bacterium]